MTVLIVDDSRLMVTKITELLEEVHTITTIEACGTYAHAIHLFDTFKPGVALLDINLPDKSGVDLLQHVKKHSPATTVIMVTNQNSDYYKKICFKLGADFFLDKSNDFETIPDILTSLS